MIATLAWKEYREQRAVWLAVVAMAALVLATMTALLQPAEMENFGALGLPAAVVVLLSLAAVYGLACGASMFAGELEARTLPFLDSLPAGRASLWLGKVVIGFVLSLTQGVLLAWVGVAAGPDVEAREQLFWVLPLTAAEAFAWGLVGSALVRSALPASAIGAMPLSLSWLLGGVMFWPPAVLGVFARLLLVAVALFVSHRLFCAVDRTRTPFRRQRVRGAQAPPPRDAAPDGAPSPIAALVWLTLRQGWAEATVLLILAFLEGFFLPVGGVGQWLLVTLIVGVLCGTGAFRDEQAGEAARFLGERRLPPGLFWVVKLGMWLALGAALAVVMLTAGAIAAASEGAAGLNRFALDLLLDTGAGRLFLILGLAYGFAVGQLVALAVRKAAVAVVLSTLLAAPAAAVWIPSAVQGGLPAWLALAPAALLLAAGFLVRREWASERLASPRAILTLAVAAGLAVLVTAAALVWRVAAVPEGGVPFDVAAFELSLPPPEKNLAGTAIRRAVQGLKQREQELEPQGGGMAGPPAAPPAFAPGGAEGVAGGPVAGPDRNFLAEAGVVAEQGWTAATPGLSRWLDRMFEGEWARELREATGQPLGVVENPTFLKISSTIETSQHCLPMARLVAARALQQQELGDDAEALRHLVSLLSLSRNLCNKAVPVSCMVGLAVERVALVATERWLERAQQPPLLREALAELARHEAELPPPEEAVMAEYLVLRNTLTDSGQIAQLAGRPGHLQPTPAGRWVAATLQAPWERLRAERLLNAACAGQLRASSLSYPQAEALHGSLPPNSVGDTMILGWKPADDGPAGEAVRQRLGSLLASSWLHRMMPGSGRLHLARAAGLARLRATRALIALVLYRAEQGRPAESLEALAPRYLPAVPTDPFDERPLRYRAPKDGVAGHGAVWSVGPDGDDHGGVGPNPELALQARAWAAARADLVFGVPPAAP